MIETCPICDTETADLYGHVFYDHLLWERAGDGVLMTSRRVCWCGETMYCEPISVLWWSHHIDMHGGLERHILECTLGVK